jgi:hypothetical protein
MYGPTSTSLWIPTHPHSSYPPKSQWMHLSLTWLWGLYSSYWKGFNFLLISQVWKHLHEQ